MGRRRAGHSGAGDGGFGGALGDGRVHAGASRAEWCEEGHRGYVLAGEIEYEFDDGREPLRAGEGDAFLLPHAPLGAGAHRGRNLAPGPTRLFLIDDRPEG
jgi:uncharacterized cupin superfamily protein